MSDASFQDAPLSPSAVPLLSQKTPLESEQEALRAFVAFTEAASHTDDIDQLAALALTTLQSVLPGCSAVFYELDDQRWQVRQYTSELKAELMAILHNSLPLETPAFAQLLSTRQPIFVDGWTETEQQVNHTAQFQTVALYPVESQGRVCATLTVALQSQPQWSTRDKSVIGALGRSFSLLYDRLATAKQLRDRQQEAERRSQVLEAFATLSSELSAEEDEYALIQRAMEVVLNQLPPGHAAYWEPEGPLWRMKAHINDVGNATLQAMMEAGLPTGQMPTLDQPWTTHTPFYQDQYAPGIDVSAEMTTHVYAVASIPIWQGQSVRGVMNFTTFQPHLWQPADQALLTTVTQSLQLALDRTAKTRQLQERTAGLDAFVAFTESAGVENDVLALARQAINVVQANLHDVSLAYYERVGDLWVGTLWSTEVTEVDLNLLVQQARRDVGAEFSSQPIRWEVPELPMVQGDPAMLQQVMTNLLSNAVKYSHTREVSELRIWVEESTRAWTIRVQDNGVGFNPKYTNKLFGIFQRLHHERDFSGTGVGLATVRRIVLRHGGQVEAASPDETGAVFSFTLPKP